MWSFCAIYFLHLHPPFHPRNSRWYTWIFLKKGLHSTWGVAWIGVFCLMNDFMVALRLREPGVIMSTRFLCTVCKNVLKGRTTWKIQEVIRPWKANDGTWFAPKDGILDLLCWQGTVEIQAFSLQGRNPPLSAVLHLPHKLLFYSLASSCKY